MKRFWASFLAAIMLLAALPMSASAASLKEACMPTKVSVHPNRFSAGVDSFPRYEVDIPAQCISVLLDFKSETGSEFSIGYGQNDYFWDSPVVAPGTRNYHYSFEHCYMMERPGGTYVLDQINLIVYMGGDSVEKVVYRDEDIPAIDFGTVYFQAVDPSKSENVVEKFNDISNSAWYKDSVQYVYQFGIMTGMGGTDSFNPMGKLSRAQFATVLWRMSGAPKMNYSAKFPDVKAGTFYTDAVLWASENGIITGYTSGARKGQFGPADMVTREQMAVMIHRYAKYVYSDSETVQEFSNLADISSYKDAGRVSGFAKEAFSWCNAEGIINGKTATTLDPQGQACRAECATILMRFDKCWEKYYN